MITGAKGMLVDNQVWVLLLNVVTFGLLALPALRPYGSGMSVIYSNIM